VVQKKGAETVKWFIICGQSNVQNGPNGGAGRSKQGFGQLCLKKRGKSADRRGAFGRFFARYSTVGWGLWGGVGLVVVWGGWWLFWGGSPPLNPARSQVSSLGGRRAKHGRKTLPNAGFGEA